MKAEMITAGVAVVSLAVSFMGSIFTLGWWLSGKFRKIEKEASKKHLENLERFRRIGLALSKLGYQNGHHLEP